MSTVKELIAVSTDLRIRAEALAHVIVMGGVRPGPDKAATNCQCDQCRLVAKEMAEAGYMTGENRWWETELDTPTEDA